MIKVSSIVLLIAATLAGVAMTACAETDSASEDETGENGGDKFEVDPSAPTVAYTQLAIDASPREVWAVLFDVDRWSEWLPNVERAHLDGPLAAGSVIRWKENGRDTESRLVLVEPERRVVWNGTEGAVHYWELVPTATGTLLHNNVSIENWQSDAGEGSSAFLEQLLQTWNELLAERVRALR